MCEHFWLIVILMFSALFFGIASYHLDNYRDIVRLKEENAKLSQELKLLKSSSDPPFRNK